MSEERRQQRRTVVRDPELPEGAPGSLRLVEPKPKPLGSTEVARALLERAAKATTAHPSVKLARNSAGNVQVEVSVPVGVLEGVDTLEDASAKATEIFNALDMVFPWRNPKADK